MFIWRLFLGIIDLFEKNPIRALALIVFVLAAINHKTLTRNLPDAIPEVDAWLAQLAPKPVTMSGSIAGAGKCWRMNFTFFEKDGSPLLTTERYIAQITGEQHQATLSLPHRPEYLLRLESEVYLANPETCLPIGSGAIIRSNAVEQVLSNTAAGIDLVNTCDFSKTNRCELEMR